MQISRAIDPLKTIAARIMRARWLPRAWIYGAALVALATMWDALGNDLTARFREVFSQMTGTGYDEYLPSSTKLVVDFFNRHLESWLIWSIPGALLIIAQNWPRVPQGLLTLGCVSVAWLIISADVVDNWQAATYSAIGERPSPGAFVIKQVLIGALMLSPMALLWFHRRRSLLQRYLLTNLLVPFVFCFIGVATLWIILDLSNHFPEFVEAGLSLKEMLAFYGIQMPQTVVIVFPVAVLLSLLYALGRLSRSNELIAMLSAGVSMRQILTPVFVIGGYAAFISLVCNFHWAPNSEALKTELLEEAKARVEARAGSSEEEEFTRAVLFHNEIDDRTWFAGSIPLNLSQRNRIRNIELYIHESDGTPVRTVVADQAFWWPPIPGQTRDDFNGHWTFYHGLEITHLPGGGVEVSTFSSETNDRLNAPLDWSESPWSLMSSSFTPEYLGVQELTSYLKTVPPDTNPVALAPFVTHWHYRFAQPMLNLVVALIAAPLGIAFSRRGVVGGVAIAVVIVFALLFVDSFFLNLARGNHFPAWLSVWCPHLIFGLIGGVMLYFRIKNRELPKISRLWRSGGLPTSGSQPATGTA